MLRRHSGTLLLAALWLSAGVARAQAPPGGTKAPGRQEEKRRKLLEGMGLDKRNSPPAAPAPAPEDAGSVQAAPRPAAEPTGRAAGAGKAGGPAAPSFRRVIHPLLMATCGACHRAGAPAATTRLTLSGDATVDFGPVAGMVTVRDPAASALLVKASGQQHAGGSPWPQDSAAYARVLAWISKGARLDAAGAEPPAPVSPGIVAATPLRKRAPEVSAAPATPLSVPEPQVPAGPTAVPAPTGFTPGAHPILMTACAVCHRPGAPASMTRLVLSGDAAADESVARALVDPAAPAQSPLLTKASGEQHGGGAIVAVGDARYQTLLTWAASPPQVSAPVPPPAVAVAAAAPAAALAPPEAHARPSGVELPLGFLLNGRFDLAFERRQFSGNPFGSTGVNALRSYHHFLFLSRANAADPCGVSLELLTLQFWEVNCRLTGRSHPVQVRLGGGKILVPFGADPLYHQSYGGLAGFDQRILPVIWAQEGMAAHLVHQRGGLVLTDDLFVVRGYTLGRADAVLNLQNDFSPVDNARLGWGNRAGAAWMGISAWYSAYFNPLGFGRHLFMQAVDVTVWRQRSIPVLGHFSLGAGLLHADVAGGDSDGQWVGGAGQDYYHFGSYFQLRYHPTDWLFLQYRQGKRTFDNRRALVLDNSRLTSADASTHSFGVVARSGGLTGGLFTFVNLEKADEIPDDLFRASVTYEF